MQHEGADAAAADELTGVLLDKLAPVVAMYRREVGRRVGLDPVELVCLDQLRHLGPAPASAVGSWVGLTRSALSTFLRGLEATGHVLRHVPRRRGQEVEVEWRSNADRDAVLDDPQRRALVAWWAVQVADMLASTRGEPRFSGGSGRTVPSERWTDPAPTGPPASITARSRPSARPPPG